MVFLEGFGLCLVVEKMWANGKKWGMQFFHCLGTEVYFS